MFSEELKSICLEIADLEGGLMYGYVSFSYDSLMSAMGAGHPAEILDSILAPVFWPAVSGKDVDAEAVIELCRQLMEYKNSFHVKELSPMIKKLKKLLEENGVALSTPKIKLEVLKKKYTGKVIDQEKLHAAGDVWNLDIKNGKLCGHFYWNDERHRYYDEFSIVVDEEMHIVDIEPLETNTADGGSVEPCRYTLVHNGEFEKLLNAATFSET